MANNTLNNSIDEIDDLKLDELFFEKKYESKYRLIKSNRDKDAILFNGYYYNHQRDNKNSRVFKCRQKNGKKECTGTFTLMNDDSYSCKSHQCAQLMPIQCDIMIINAEIEAEILRRPTLSIKKLYDEKEVELTIKYDAKQVAKYWPQFDSVDSAFFSYKNKLVPALPDNIDDLKDLPQNYKVTTDNRRFLSSPIELFSKLIIMASLIGLTILSKSKKWYCDGTFKSSPKFYYQHYIIHGSFKHF